jgi:hypothetical protein
MAEHWIQGAIKHPGALHKELGVPEGKKIPKGKIEKAAHSSNPKLAKRARLAETLEKMHGKGGRGKMEIHLHEHTHHHEAKHDHEHKSKHKHEHEHHGSNYEREEAAAEANEHVMRR